MRPVAWTTMPDADDWEFISGDKDPNNHLDGVWHPLYTADQLREARKEESNRLNALKCSVKKLMQDAFYAGTNTPLRAAHWEEDLAKTLNGILQRNGEHDWHF